MLYVFVVAACRRPDLNVLSHVEGKRGAADVICSRKGKEAASGGLGAPDLLTQGDWGGQWMLEDRGLRWRGAHTVTGGGCQAAEFFLWVFLFFFCLPLDWESRERK